MSFFDILTKLFDWIGHTFISVLTCYHLVSSSIFLNTAAEEAAGLEKMGDLVLAPFQYLFAGHSAYSIEGPTPLKYELRQRFDYEGHYMLKMAGSLVALPFSLAVGSALKGSAFLFSTVRARHGAIAEAAYGMKVHSNQAYYRSLGIKLGESFTEKVASLGYLRKVGDENHLSAEKEALKEIVSLLNKNEILYWVDCGTCLGAYRYGGIIPWDFDIDIAVLEPDFSNVKRVLNALDKSKYQVEDWSNRSQPKTYIRVYVRSTREYIDIYHFAIHPEKRTIQYILSNECSRFMPKWWKIRESRFKVETPFDLVFPLKMADFDGIEVPVPNQMKSYLQLRYGDNLDPVKIYNETTGKYEKDLSHPYWQRAYVH